MEVRKHIGHTAEVCEWDMLQPSFDGNLIAVDHITKVVSPLHPGIAFSGHLPYE
jgi:hypothetical protein